ncbi:MAG: hypothetical protein SFV51_08920, partial [Bryobacteraceae bacterium]|nr:hypothetical protein [Bryobacteraceae bacterium]
AMGVSAVLEGSVRRSGDQIRIVTQLISVDDGFHLWARSYDRKAGDLLAVQRDVSRLVASELKARLSEAGGWDQKGRPAPGSEAQRAYLEGYRLFQMDEIRNEWTSGVPPRMAAVIDAFERATRLDPQFAAAWAALAEATGWAADFDERSRLAMRQRAGEAARTAIALDPANALASLTLGNLYWSQDWDLRRSEPLLRRAVELSPRSTGMYSDYAGVLVAMERYDDAVDSLRRVQLLEPGSPRPAGRLAELAAMRGDAAGARAYANEALSRDPGYRYALWALAFADELEGKTDAAESRYRRILELHPSEDRTLASLGHLLGRAGKTVEANRIASRLQSMIERGRRREVFEALVRTALGQREAALGLLEDAWRKRDPNLLNLAVESRFRPLATERRFQQLLARVRALR